jgi:hypothetical protein
MILLTLMMSYFSIASVTSESFMIQIKNQSISVVAPSKPQKRFAVIVENQSLTTQVAKFSCLSENLKFVTVLPGKSETVEIENSSDKLVSFIPLSPAFQDVRLEFGKKTYEIPTKD